MEGKAGRVLATVACLLWLNGCERSSKPGDLFSPASHNTEGSVPPGAVEPTSAGSLGSSPDLASDFALGRRLGDDPTDDVSLGKKHFRAAQFDLAERHFRRAVASHPHDLESWIGLAACYDRLRRFDLADRAYEEAQKIAGPRAEILNNRGYSYMLRDDYPRARAMLLQAQAQDPASPYVKNNLELLEKSSRADKAIH
jgi:tetratricopeptide (TPR) repeat protein